MTEFRYAGPDGEGLTLDKYFEEWIGRKRLTAKGNSIKTYKNRYWKHLSPSLGAKKLSDIRRREILGLQKTLAEEVSVNTANVVMKTLCMVLNDAVRDEVLERNPAANIGGVRVQAKRAAETYHRALTEEEQKAFMTALSGDHYYEFLAFLLCTGLRSGEAGALTWADIDEKKKVIHITKTLTFDEGGGADLGTPKTISSVRDIPLTDTMRKILLAQKGKKNGRRKELVFCTSVGDVMNSHAINRAIRRALSRLSEQGIVIEPFTAHALRDTFATRFIEQGGNPQTLKALLGHSSLHLTMDLYSHVLPNTKQKEMDMLKIFV